MNKFFVAALLTMALVAPTLAAGVTVSGYIDVGYIAAGGGRSINGANTQGIASGATNGNVPANNGFALNEVNVDIASQLTNDISAFVSLDAAAPALGMGVDYAYVDFVKPFSFAPVSLRAGRIPSVVGIEQRVSESNQNKFINLSLASRVTVGSMDGVAMYGSFGPVSYAAAVSNTDMLGSITALGNGLDNNRAGLRPGNNNGVANRATNDNNNNKALSGRIGVTPLQGLEVGASAVYDQPWSPGLANAGLPTNPTRTTWGVDASYTYGSLTAKSEYYRVKEDGYSTAGTAVANNYLSVWYGELFYDINAKYGVGVRYNQEKIWQRGAGAWTTASNANGTVADVSSWQFAGVYNIASNVALKAEYDFNSEKYVNGSSVPGATNKIDNNVFALSLVGSF